MPPGQSGTFHIVARCVRRAFLWGIDTYTDQNYDHRKAWVEQRILLLSNAFAASLLSYAVMSNRLHLVIANRPAAATTWSELEVAERCFGFIRRNTPKMRRPTGMFDAHTGWCGLAAL